MLENLLIWLGGSRVYTSEPSAPISEERLLPKPESVSCQVCDKRETRLMTNWMRAYINYQIVPRSLGDYKCPECEQWFQDYKSFLYWSWNTYE